MTDASPRARRLSDREQEVVRTLSGSFGWPTVLLTLALLAVYATTAVAWAQGSMPLGVFWPMMMLWWLPSRFAILLLNVFFQWLPHHPFDRTDRFGATRINRFPGSTWLLLEQDRHLTHHLYPSIPWYRYHVAQRELADVLRDHKAVVEGRHFEPYTPIRWNVTAPDLHSALD